MLLKSIAIARREAWRRDGSRLPPEMDALEADLRRAIGDVEIEEVLPVVWIPAVEAGARLNRSRERIGQMIRSKQLHGRKVAGKWMVDEADVDAEVAARAAAETTGFRQMGTAS